jgi:ABC-type multidrug transport system ATPase subunit
MELVKLPLFIWLGLIKPDSGKVFINDRDVTILPMYKKAREGIGYLAQEPSIFRKLTVRQNIEAVLEMHLKDKNIIKEKNRYSYRRVKFKKGSRPKRLYTFWWRKKKMRNSKSIGNRSRFYSIR